MKLAVCQAARLSAFRASRPALAWPERRASESDGLGAEAAARAAPWGRLETVQKVLTRAEARQLRLGRLDS